MSVPGGLLDRVTDKIQNRPLISGAVSHHRHSPWLVEHETHPGRVRQRLQDVRTPGELLPVRFNSTETGLAPASSLQNIQVAADQRQATASTRGKDRL